MNFTKWIVVVALAVFVVIAGLNQYESYKLNKRANEKIDKVEKEIQKKIKSENKRKWISRLKSDLKTLELDILSKQVATGKFPEKLLSYRKTGNNPGEWSKEKDFYVYHLEDESVTFSYNNKTGEFKCTANCGYIQ